jgi:hypothetical protein
MLNDSAQFWRDAGRYVEDTTQNAFSHIPFIRNAPVQTAAQVEWRKKQIEADMVRAKGGKPLTQAEKKQISADSAAILKVNNEDADRANLSLPSLPAITNDAKWFLVLGLGALFLMAFGGNRR